MRISQKDDQLCGGEPCRQCARDAAPMFCRFLDTETCRMGLNIAEHQHTAQGFQHPDGLDSRGYWAFGDKAVQ